MGVRIKLIENIYIFTDSVPSDLVVLWAWITECLNKIYLDDGLVVEDELINERGAPKRQQRREEEPKRFCARICPRKKLAVAQLAVEIPAAELRV